MPLRAPLATSEELLRVLVAGSSAERPDGEKWRLRFFLDGEAIEPPRELLPRLDDRDLETYAARMEDSCPGRKYAIVLNNYHRFGTEHWMRARDFFGSLFSQVGVPPGGTTADIFVGNYARTPFGVHRDTLDVFTSVVSGRKRLLVWPSEVFEGLDIKKVEYTEYLDDAIVLEGEAGDLFYWPSSYWHIAESTGGLTATLALGEFRESAGEVVLEDMRNAVESLRTPERISDEADHGQAGGRGEVVPSTLTNAAVSLAESLRRRVVGRWVQRLSNQGLSSTSRRDDMLGPDDTIRCPALHPIVMLIEGDVLLLGACGHILPVPDFPQIVALVDELNTGARVRVGDLVRRYSDEHAADASVDADALLTIVQRLHSFRAFDEH